MDWIWYTPYAVPILALYMFTVVRRHRRERENRGVLEESQEAGLMAPASLHPVIDTNICIGCEACVHACPEYPKHRVLGVIRGKAGLVSPSDCIGHGACKTACPVSAISLVFGTKERGVDIPMVSPQFESNVPGLFIAGELGGMGLIRNAIEQGRQAMESILARLGNRRSDGMLDVAIVGAGPAGLSATLLAHERGLRYVTIEQNALGGTVANFPRGKLVMTAPAQMPIVGPVKFAETSKETLIDFWQNVESTTGINIHYKERMEDLEPIEGGFRLDTSKNSYRARTVLLALGRRGTPRRLEVPGEELPKVAYTLIDPAQYAGRKVLVVGGGDSALEAAHSIADQPGAEVTLSYRSSNFSRAKRKNRDKVERYATEQRIRLMLESNVLSIDAREVELSERDQTHRIPNDAVIVCAGGILPTGFLRDVGIQIETKYGQA